MYNKNNPNFWDIENEYDATHYLHSMIANISSIDDNSERNKLFTIYNSRKYELRERGMYPAETVEEQLTEISVSQVEFDVVERVVDDYCIHCPYLFPDEDDPCNGCHVRGIIDSMKVR